MVLAQTAVHEPAPAVPLRPLAVLVAAVLAIHLLLLQAAPGAINLEPPAPVRKFITRTVEINRPAPDAATPDAAPAPDVPAVPAPRQRPAMKRLPAETPTSPAAPAAVEAPPAPVPAPAPPAAAPAEPPAPPAPAPPPARLEEGPRPVAFSIPGSIKLNYNVTGEAKKQAWNARSELVWRHDGTAYDARMEVSAFLVGARTQTSAGRITAEGLAPSRFSDKSRQEVAAHFDRERGRVVFSANTPEATLLAGAQDRLSVFLQLGAMIAGEPSKYPQGAAISIQTIGPREAESWVFTVDGEDKLNLPGGELRALKLTRSPRRDFDLKAEVWLAPAMGYLPARLRLTQQNGDFVDQQLRSTDRP
ncbi:MAG: DUF3108 domain-containing protein [Comamonadaceae bacterium]|nr:MAG: DUF3108 domain-containing protein [Comamonadaceae bacterium]